MKKYDLAKNIKKFDTIETLYNGKKTVDFLTIHTGSDLMIINYMDGTRLFTMQSELVHFERGFKPVNHKEFVHDIEYFYNKYYIR